MRKPNRVWGIALVGLVAAGAGTAAADPYSVEDLQVLVRHQKWDEVFAHMSDVPDAKRGPAWHDAVERASLGRMSAAGGGELGQLDEGENYHERYGFEPDGPFEKRFHAIVAHLAQPGTAWKAGQVAGAHYDTETAIKMFTLVLGKSDSGKCGDAVVGKMIVSGLRYEAKWPTEKQAHALAVTCYDHIADALRAELWTPGTGPDTDYFLNTCGLLKSHGKLSGLQTRECAQ
jgi:hypothetical protein